ncbi:hypothetical protein E3Q18_03084 [Wallemia mellicola]|nr:hypothetical protein E3Q18_03084 [Wallemia mellicola]
MVLLVYLESPCKNNSHNTTGTGKTSTILAIAKKIYGGNWKRNVLELNASDDRGIDVVRDQIKSFAQTRTLFSDGFKLIILDEADLMTQQAQGALRRIIEHYTPTTRFCIICNYVNKITPAIMSRCTRFRFSPLPYAHLDKRLVEVIENEAVQIDDDAKKALLNLTKGDMRRALNILQACHTACMPERISIKDVYNVTAAPQPEAIEYIVNTLLKDEISTCYSKIHQVKRQNGLALQDILTGVYDYIQTIEFPTATKVAILELLAEVEHRLSKAEYEGNIEKYLDDLLEFVSDEYVKSLVNTHTNSPRLMQREWSNEEAFSEWMNWAEKHNDESDEWKDEQIRSIAIGIIREEWPNSLQNHIRKCNRLGLPREYKNYERPTTKRINLKCGSVNNLGMTPKKIHECERLSTLIGNDFEHHKNLIDVGSGQGYLSRTLSRAPFDFQVLAVDSDANNVQRSEYTSNKRDIGLTTGRLDHAVAFLDRASLERVNREWEARGNERSTLIGLHPCGDLSVEVIEAFLDGVDDYDGLVLVSCCYNQLSAKNFPLSQQVRSQIERLPEGRFEWEYDYFGLTVHTLAHWTYEPKKYWDMARAPMWKLLCRSRLAECLRRVGRPHFSENRLGKLRDRHYKSWETYRQGAAEKLGLEPSELADDIDDEFWRLIDWRMKVFWTAKARCGDMFESLIHLDRFLYVSEQTQVVRATSH